MFKDVLEEDCNPVQYILGKIKKSGERGQDQKTLISVFASFFSASAKNSFLEGRLTVSALNFTVFAVFPNFSKMLSLKSTYVLLLGNHYSQIL